MGDFLKDYLDGKNDAFWGPYPASGRSSHYGWAFSTERARIEAEKQPSFSSFGSSAPPSAPYPYPVGASSPAPTPRAEPPPPPGPAPEPRPYVQVPVGMYPVQLPADRDGDGSAAAVVAIIGGLLVAGYMWLGPDASAAALSSLREAIFIPAPRAAPAPQARTIEAAPPLLTLPERASDLVPALPEMPEAEEPREAALPVDEPAEREAPEMPPAADVFAVSSLGLQVADETGAIDGVRIEAVSADGWAAAMGLAPGDVVTGLRYGDGRAPLVLTGARDLVDAMQDADALNEEFSLTIRRDGIVMFASRNRPAL